MQNASRFAPLLPAVRNEGRGSDQYKGICKKMCELLREHLPLGAILLQNEARQSKINGSAF